MLKAFIDGFRQRLSAYLKIQLFTKALFALVLSPLFWMLTKVLLRSSGLRIVTNQTIFAFLLSWSGMAFLFLLFVLVLLVLLWEMIALIEISNDTQEMPLQEKLKHVLTYVPRFFSKGGLLVLLYLVIFVPLTGFGLTLGLFKSIGIPSFILEFILANRILSVVYFVAIAAMLLLSLSWIFCFHAMVLEKLTLSASFKRSRQLIWANLKHFLLNFLGLNLLLALAGGLVLALWSILPSFLLDILPDGWLSGGIILLFFILQNVAFILLAFFAPAFEVHLLTALFNTYRGQPQRSAFKVLKPLQSKLLIGFAVLLITVSVSVFFQKVFEERNSIEVIAHRGGNLAAENSAKGLMLAKTAGATFAEIDIQRTQDGHYVLNHDDDFFRLAGEKRSSSQMTLEEIGQLRIKDLFDSSRESQPVAKLEEVLELCDNDFGILIELKGKTADQKMVDDVVAQIRARNLEDSACIISLDRALIEYTENHYPEIVTGYLYYLAFGDLAELKADILIIEESSATDGMLEGIRKAGKQVYVWTINTPEQMEKLLDRDIDGMITDYPAVLLEKMLARNELSQKDLMLQLFD